MPRKIEISHRTILFTLGVLAGTWLVLQVRDILFLLFVSFILTTVLRPLVDQLTKYRIPRVLSILLIYIVVVGGIVTIIGSVVPQIAVQTTRLVQELPQVTQRLMPTLDVNIAALTQEFAPLTQNVVKFGFEIVSNVLTVVTILVFTFYFLLGRNSLHTTLEQFLGKDRSAYILTIIIDVEQKLGAWARGQIILMAVIGIATYIGLVALHLDFALPLALIAALLEMVPMVGPIISAIPAILVAFTVSPLLALSVAALYFVIQQLENHLVVPYIMRRSVGLSPILTITAFMIGARFEGVMGAILAVPAILVAQVVIGHVMTQQQLKKEL